MAVHGLGHQRIALRPVIAAPGDEPDAHGIAAGHEPEAVVLDLVNPVGAGPGSSAKRVRSAPAPSDALEFPGRWDRCIRRLWVRDDHSNAG